MRNSRVFAVVCLAFLAVGFQNCSKGFDGANYGVSVNQTPQSSSALPLPSPSPVVALPAPIAGQNYVLSFDDEFLSPTDVTASSNWDGVAKWYNGTEQCCLTDTDGHLPAGNYPTVVNGKSVNPYSFVPGGGLNITLSKQNNAWYSGVMTSVDNKGTGFAQQYGYFEMMAKLPGTVGSWPAFWMLDLDGRKTGQTGGEIDIFEQYNTFTDRFCSTFHDWAGNTTPYYNCSMMAPGETTGFHKFALLWTATTMTIYYDDVALGSTPTPAIMKRPYYMLVDLGLGGGWPTANAPASSVMQIKYVRAYAQK